MGCSLTFQAIETPSLLLSGRNEPMMLATEEHGSVQIQLSKIVKASLIGRDYEIDKKTKRPKRKKRAGRFSREGSAKGDE